MIKILTTITRNKLFLLLFIGLIIRLILTNVVYSFDAASFVIWAKYLTTHKLAELFEYLPDGYTPYPPIYYYVLAIMGRIIGFFNLWSYEKLTYVLIKLPVISADIVSTLIIYKFTYRYLSKKSALISAAFYYLHPAIIYNTSVWGQIDSVIILLGLLTVAHFIYKKYFWALFCYLLGVLTKLQSLALLPLVLYLSLINLKLTKIIKYGLVLIILAILPFIPVIQNKGVQWTWDYFFTIPNWYAYTSVYAYNLWAPFGFIISDNNKLFNLIQFKYLGIAIFWIVALFILLPFKNPKNRNPAVIMFAAFLLWYDFSYFATRIHSRYLIYSFGFFAPFFFKFPVSGILLSLLMFADFLLPNKNPLFAPLVAFLNHPVVIILFVIYALGLFCRLLRNYHKLLL